MISLTKIYDIIIYVYCFKKISPKYEIVNKQLEFFLKKSGVLEALDEVHVNIKSIMLNILPKKIHDLQQSAPKKPIIVAFLAKLCCMDNDDIIIPSRQ